MRYLALSALYGLVAANLLPTQNEHCLKNFDVELGVVLDGSGSFKGFLQDARTLVGNMIDELERLAKGLKVSLFTFSDHAGYGESNSKQCFKEYTSVTGDLKEAKAQAKKLQYLSGGGDTFPEMSLDAVTYVAGSGKGFTPIIEGEDTIRIVLLITDDKSEVYSGSGAQLTDPAHEIRCERNRAYVTYDQAKKAAKDSRVYWFVTVPQDTSSSASKRNWWQDVLGQKFGYKEGTYEALTLDLGSASLLNKLVTGINQLACDIGIIEPPGESTSTTTTTTTSTSTTTTTTKKPTTTTTTTTTTKKPTTTTTTKKPTTTTTTKKPTTTTTEKTDEPTPEPTEEPTQRPTTKVPDCPPVDGDDCDSGCNGGCDSCDDQPCRPHHHHHHRRHCRGSY